jgi:hypothetical protein
MTDFMKGVDMLKALDGPVFYKNIRETKEDPQVLRQVIQRFKRADNTSATCPANEIEDRLCNGEVVGFNWYGYGIVWNCIHVDKLESYEPT